MAVSGRPLSNTDASSPELAASTKGAHSRPGACGSLRSDIGSPESFSPIRVPPPALEKTVRPSAASRADEDHCW